MREYNELAFMALEQKYPNEIRMLRQYWDDYRNDERMTMSEEEYIKSMLPQILEQKQGTFKDFDEENRMSNIASKFKIKNNQEIQKVHYKTGFKMLDEATDGGLTPGVHYIGAISSLGKSTFCLNIADNMAAMGMPVIIYSLEMTRVDLTAKLVSRHTFIDSAKDAKKAKASNELLSKEMSAKFSDEDWDVVFTAADKVSKIGSNITIIENRMTPTTVDDIALYMDEYVKTYGVKPVLIVDYLQILSAPKTLRGCSDKQLVDYNVAKFRSISATYDIPIIVISSFNRDSYNAKVGLQSFKDSGNIEYSSDSLMGLQLKGVGEPNFDVDMAKSAYPRKVELVILKQRYGKGFEKIPLTFYTKFNYFEEAEPLLDILGRKLDLSFPGEKEVVSL